MKKCDDTCYPICDFCYHFRNGWFLGNRDIEDGICVYNDGTTFFRPTNICSQCDNFTCFMSVNIFKRIWFKLFVTRRSRART